MRTSGVASEKPLTVVVVLVALGFLMVLAGGPGQLLLAIEHTLEAGADALFQVYQNLRA